jgi:hypothetical protein
MQAKPVQKTIGGVTFEDRFPHLHDDTPEALEWQWARDSLAQQAAEASPNYAPVRDRLRQLPSADSMFAPAVCRSKAASSPRAWDAANAGDRPIHLRVWRNTGHGVGPAQAAAYTAEWLGMTAAKAHP